jgi:hypothetical protein
MSVHRTEPRAGDFDEASAGPAGVAEYAFIRDPRLGLGVSGPYAEIARLASSLSEKIGDVTATLYPLDHDLVGRLRGDPRWAN